MKSGNRTVKFLSGKNKTPIIQYIVMHDYFFTTKNRITQKQQIKLINQYVLDYYTYYYYYYYFLRVLLLTVQINLVINLVYEYTGSFSENEPHPQ